MVALTDTPITLTSVTSGIDENQNAEFYIAGVGAIETPATGNCLDSGSATVPVTAPKFGVPSSIT